MAPHASSPCGKAPAQRRAQVREQVRVQVLSLIHIYTGGGIDTRRQKLWLLMFSAEQNH